MTEAQLDFEDGCWKSGYRAYESKIPMKSCPLASGSRAHKAWQDGWKRARHEYEDEPPEE